MVLLIQLECEWIVLDGTGVVCEACSRHEVIDAARMRFAILTLSVAKSSGAKVVRAERLQSGSESVVVLRRHQQDVGAGIQDSSVSTWFDKTPRKRTFEL